MAQIDNLLQLTVKSQASDLHLNAGKQPYLRIHGDIKVQEALAPLSAEQLMRMFEEIMPEHNCEQFKRSNDTDFAYSLPGVARFRVNIFSDYYGPGGVFRFIPSQIISVSELNLPKSVVDLCFLSKGLVVVTGPTGCGKSTTLAALIDQINRYRCDHIITIEDPIEFLHENKKCLVNQREVHTHTQTFKNALRAALREDPDIVLVGEMRDLETIEIALETAETGHLVFGTLHTSTAASTVERIIEQFPGSRQNQIRQMLANSLKGVIAQTLLKRKDGSGRVAAMEVLIGNMAVSSLIREGKTYQLPSVMQTGSKMGMSLLNDSLMRLVRNRVVTPEEAYLKAVEKLDLENRLKQSGIYLNTSFKTEAILELRAGDVARSSVIASAPGATSQNKSVPATDDFQAFRQRMFQKRSQQQS